MIPVGTLCYVVRSDVPDIVGRICTVGAHGGRCGSRYCAAVCSIDFSDGDRACISNWNRLRPIAPPRQSIDAPTCVPKETEPA